MRSFGNYGKQLMKLNMSSMNKSFLNISKRFASTNDPSIKIDLVNKIAFFYSTLASI